MVVCPGGRFSQFHSISPNPLYNLSQTKMAEFPTTNGVVTFSSPPEGYEVDFDNPQRNLHIQHYWLFAIGGFLACLALAQRLYTKLCLTKGLQIDDGM